MGNVSLKTVSYNASEKLWNRKDSYGFYQSTCLSLLQQLDSHSSRLLYKQVPFLKRGKNNEF